MNLLAQTISIYCLITLMHNEKCLTLKGALKSIQFAQAVIQKTNQQSDLELAGLPQINYDLIRYVGGHDVYFQATSAWKTIHDHVLVKTQTTRKQSPEQFKPSKRFHPNERLSLSEIYTVTWLDHLGQRRKSEESELFGRSTPKQQRLALLNPTSYIAQKHRQPMKMKPILNLHYEKPAQQSHVENGRKRKSEAIILNLLKSRKIKREATFTIKNRASILNLGIKSASKLGGQQQALKVEPIDEDLAERILKVKKKVSFLRKRSIDTLRGLFKKKTEVIMATQYLRKIAHKPEQDIIFECEKDFTTPKVVNMLYANTFRLGNFGLIDSQASLQDESPPISKISDFITLNKKFPQLWRIKKPNKQVQVYAEQHETISTFQQSPSNKSVNNHLQKSIKLQLKQNDVPVGLKGGAPAKQKPRIYLQSKIHLQSLINQLQNKSSSQRSVEFYKKKLSIPTLTDKALYQPFKNRILTATRSK